MSSETQSAANVSTILEPALGPLRRHTHTYDLMRQCIHCGFCLPTCPTYAVLGVEMDSPRGRIYQMQAVAEGRMEISPEFVEHMYCCLGCRACETACPSGVQFGKLIEAAREQIQIEVAHTPLFGEQLERQNGQQQLPEPKGSAQYPLHLDEGSTRALESLTERLLRRFFFDLMLPSRLVTSLVFTGLKVYQRSGLQTLAHRTGLLDVADALPTPFQGKLKTPEALMPSARGDLLPQPIAEYTPAIGKQRYRVGFISGCIMDQVFRDINEATIRVLAANGCEVVTPPQQQCCGALHVHAGEAERGRMLARHNIDVFEPYACDYIIINSAGCGSNLKEYGHLLRDDPLYAKRAEAFSAKVKDVSEFLTSIDLNRGMGEVHRTIAYHDACHLFHGQKIKQQPRDMLKTIPGLTIVPLKESEWCCGSAGIYNITNQEMASQLLERKMNNIAATGAQIIATGNPGCMMQIGLGARERGMDIQVVHPVELLDEAYRAGGLYALPVPNLAAKQQRQRAIIVGIVAGLLIGLLLSRRKRKDG
ncbi:MAG TPA: heterodisulfide reductase-related iron-sulfur binding cluster [Ktedonobacteraceae bacterium]|nr:heterodisulfide reductase-related iron-sulfur binding cluster [Ktedonobacteraceae bacterium]